MKYNVYLSFSTVLVLSLLEENNWIVKYNAVQFSILSQLYFSKFTEMLIIKY